MLKKTIAGGLRLSSDKSRPVRSSLDVNDTDLLTKANNSMTHVQEQRERLQQQRSQAQKLAAETVESMAQIETLMEEARTLRRAGPQEPQEGSVIHVVDDDEGFATGLCRLLRATGYTSRHYANAGDFLMAQIPDTAGCILLDLCLPGPSGLDLQSAPAEKDLTAPG